mmetsp:Transcript_41712/g.85272  ORF Transcript_41712/g.85272 Transcript_41712/m.85272 type:complete len:245 (+) Transcript_41712:655-1389(+)
MNFDVMPGCSSMLFVREEVMASKLLQAASTEAFVPASCSHPSRTGSALAVDSEGMGAFLLASLISLKYRRTATPSPQECSKLMAALPVGSTMSWKLLSNQRLRPLPVSIRSCWWTKLWTSSCSRQMAKRALSMSSSEALFLLFSSSFPRALAQVSRSCVVSTPRGTPFGSGALFMMWRKALRISPAGTTFPSSRRMSTFQKSLWRWTTTCFDLGAMRSSSLPSFGIRVDWKRFLYCDMSSGYVP